MVLNLSPVDAFVGSCWRKSPLVVAFLIAGIGIGPRLFIPSVGERTALLGALLFSQDVEAVEEASLDAQSRGKLPEAAGGSAKTLVPPVKNANKFGTGV